MNAPDQLILDILIHLLPVSLKALLPPESERTSSNWSSKSTLSTHRGRWCNLDLTIFSFQGVTFVEEKDLVLLLQQQRKGALGTHTVHLPTFSHQLAFLFVSWEMRERSLMLQTWVRATLDGHAWAVAGQRVDAFVVGKGFRRVRRGWGLGKGKVAVARQASETAGGAQASGGWISSSSKNLIHLLNESNHRPPSSVRHSLEGF